MTTKNYKVVLFKDETHSVSMPFANLMQALEFFYRKKSMYRAGYVENQNGFKIKIFGFNLGY